MNAVGRRKAASQKPPDWLRWRLPFGRCACRCAWFTTTLVVLLLAGAVSAAETATGRQVVPQAEPFEITLCVERLAELGRGELLRVLPKAADFGVERIVAFEENLRFLYLCGVSGQGSAESSGDTAQHRRDRRPALLRRIFVLNPSLLVIDDQVRADGKRQVAWVLESKAPLTFLGREILGAAGREHLRCRTLVPEAITSSVSVPSHGRNDVTHKITFLSERTGEGVRLLHLMGFAQRDGARLPSCTLQREDGTLRLELSLWDELTAREKVLVLWLPEGSASGKVNLFDRKGDVECPTRLLPAGILPLGETGMRMLQRWDAAYRGENLATWDSGRPASQLKQAVESATIRPCRAVELGSGTGTDAIYLATKGFDVTGIDIAPTALRLAEQKAQTAGVKVRWLLADVLRPPELERFEFLYDRGCYHEVRRHDAKGYVAAVRALARPGARILILAGNANKDSYYRSYGPPRVTEAEIRGDFAKDFKLLWLRESRFDPTPPDRDGALAWSVLLERKTEP